MNQQENWRERNASDPWLLGIMCALLAAGLVTLYSVSQAGGSSNVVAKQVLFTLIGVVPFVVFWKTPLDFWRRSSAYLYVLNIILLLLVKVIGSSKKGAERWIELPFMQLQPSEISKVLMVLTLCAYFADRRQEMHKFRTYAGSFLHCLPTFILVLTQPHMGATLVLLGTWFSICLVAGVPWKYLGPTIAGLLLMITIVFKFPQVLPDYMERRVVDLIATNKGGGDKSAAGYQQEQSVRAFATGGVTGTGFLKGEMKKGKYIPEQQNDFIFSVVGEEGGLVGCTIILSFFAALFYRIWWTCVSATEPFGRMAAMGALTVLGMHLVINLGMVLRVTPVIGLWLPFISAGGTALWLCVSLVGLVMAVSRESNKAINF